MHRRTNYESQELFVTREECPENKKKDEAVGKIKSILEKDVASKTNVRDRTARIFLGTDIPAFLDSLASTSFIAQVKEAGDIDWDANGLRLIECNNEHAVKLKMLVASRRR